MIDQSRRSLRYWLYRVRREKTEGVPADEPIGIRAAIEALPGFGGWETFAVTWDISHRAPWEIIRRKYSEEELWNWTLLAESRELPRGH